MFNCFGTNFIINSGKGNVWCLYPNKNAAVKSVQDAFGQELHEATLTKVIFFPNIVFITLSSFVSLQARVLIVSDVE